jgi:hypothetical protein
MSWRNEFGAKRKQRRNRARTNEKLPGYIRPGAFLRPAFGDGRRGATGGVESQCKAWPNVPVLLPKVVSPELHGLPRGKEFDQQLCLLVMGAPCGGDPP